MINKKLIEDRIKNFLGYGNINSNIWFIGMEEGFQGDINDLEKRFKKQDGKLTFDLINDMYGVEDHIKSFLPNSNIQRTYGKLILILLFLEGYRDIKNSMIKDYQSKMFARIDCNHANLEFMPLPSKSTNKKDWIYNKFGIDYLNTRKDYLSNIMPKRIDLYKNLINKYKPKVIIFYSFSYRKKYENIIGFKLIKENNLYYIKIDNTLFFVIPHPVARGYKKQDWLDISESIKIILNNNYINLY